MLESIHAFTGAVIAYKLNNPLLALPLALLSHFVLDLLPHWNPNLSKEKKKFGHITKNTKIIIFFDCLAGLLLGLYLAAISLPNITKSLIVLFGCLMGILPDLVEAPYYLLNQKSPGIKTLMNFQKALQWNVPMFFGILSQIIFLILLFGLF